VEAQQCENKLKEYNKLVAELQIWLKDAKRRLEQANNEEVQLKVIPILYSNVILCQVQHMTLFFNICHFIGFPGGV
jgi:hypothetical protein